MIPYFSLTQLHLGTVTIQVWGLFVALGFLIGGAVAAWRAKKLGLDSSVVWDMLSWLLLSSMFFARVFFVLFYSLDYFWQKPLEIFYIWQGGMSMMGGLFGAVLAGFLFLRHRRVDFWQYVDATIFGLPLGYFIGRIGCFLIHDHPGVPTNFFLGLQYPDGIVRHDLGLYSSLLGLFLFVIFLIMKKIKPPVGSFVVVFLIVYGVARFFLDFLRVEDVRILFLTPGQYFGILMVVGGLIICFKKKLCSKI